MNKDFIHFLIGSPFYFFDTVYVACTLCDVFATHFRINVLLFIKKNIILKFELRCTIILYSTRINVGKSSIAAQGTALYHSPFFPRLFFNFRKFYTVHTQDVILQYRIVQVLFLHTYWYTIFWETSTKIVKYVSYMDYEQSASVCHVPLNFLKL